VRNEEALHGVKGQRNILKAIRRRKANRIGHILLRSCLFKHVIEGKIEEMMELVGNRRRRRKQLLDNLEEKTGYRKLKAEALDRITR
jgi:hypothetical protein